MRRMALYALLLLMCCISVRCAPTKTCEDDDQCGEGSFCYLGTKQCAKCLTCSEYMRRDRNGICVKEPSQCGDCLPGYKEEVLTLGAMRDLCVHAGLSSTTPPAIPEVMAAAQSSWLPIVFGGSIMLAISVVISVMGGFGFVIRKAIHNTKVDVRSRFIPRNDSASRSAPVLYAPSAPPQSRSEVYDEDGERCVRGHVYGVASENYQTAAKFQNPQWVRSPTNDPGEDVTDSPAPPVVPNNENQSYLIDEDTMPSSWTPGPEYEEPPASESGVTGPHQQATATPLITSFEGILNLNASTQSANHTASSGDTHQPTFISNVTITTNVINNHSVNNAAPTTSGIFNFSNT